MWLIFILLFDISYRTMWKKKNNYKHKSTIPLNQRSILAVENMFSRQKPADIKKVSIWSRKIYVKNKTKLLNICRKPNERDSDHNTFFLTVFWNNTEDNNEKYAHFEHKMTPLTLKYWSKETRPILW